MLFVLLFAFAVVFSVVTAYYAPHKFPAPKPQLMLIQARPTIAQNRNAIG